MESEADEDWRFLRAKFEKKFQLATSKLSIAGRRFSWLQIHEPDKVLEAAAHLPDVVTNSPYWAARWPSAVALDLHLASYELEDLDVLELGCGSGIAGCSAAIRGARVKLTDAVEHAVHLAQLNTWPLRERCEYATLIWGTQRLQERYPFIIGADLVYDESQFRLLEQCVSEHLATRGKFILAEPGRQAGDAFIDLMSSCGWDYQTTAVDINTTSPIRIVVFERE